MQQKNLQRKCVIGVVEEMENSLTGFDASFDLEPTNTEREESDGIRRDYGKSCIKEMKQGKDSNKH